MNNVLVPCRTGLSFCSIQERAQPKQRYRSVLPHIITRDVERDPLPGIQGGFLSGSEDGGQSCPLLSVIGVFSPPCESLLFPVNCS